MELLEVAADLAHIPTEGQIGDLDRKERVFLDDHMVLKKMIVEIKNGFGFAQLHG
jgi:hypothetical protein